VAALDDRIGSEGGRNQVIEAFHDLRACQIITVTS
jgi:hypothetical protein